LAFDAAHQQVMGMFYKWMLPAWSTGAAVTACLLFMTQVRCVAFCCLQVAQL
jgi:hypothetical protein